MDTTETQQQQEMPPQMSAQPQDQHRWLLQMLGEWTYESEAPGGEGQEPFKTTGKETVRSVGDLWFVFEGEGKAPDGTPGHTVLTLGYDPDKQRFVGTWYGSMMTFLWVYEGELDAAGKALALHTEGPTMAFDGTTALYRETIEIKGPDHRTFTSEVQTEDGGWQPMMTSNYRRVK